MFDPGALIKTYIYIVSASLFYPVLFILALLSLLIIVYAGTFFAEWLERARLGAMPAPATAGAAWNAAISKAWVAHAVAGYIRDLRELIGGDAGRPEAVENLLQSTTLSMWKSMDRLRMLVRIAPSLGLIGTLIPMGTGLAALGQGDMTRLSADLVIAFTTTVTDLRRHPGLFFLHRPAPVGRRGHQEHGTGHRTAGGPR